MHSSPIQRYTGVYPIAPTPFTKDGEIDLEGQRRVLDCMVDQGVDGICILANYSEQFLLSDREQMKAKIGQEGVQLIDVNPEDLSLAAVNRYLEIKAHGLL